MGLSILKYPNPLLRRKAKKINRPLDPEIQNLISEMYELMKKNNGMGLAAPQVGKLIRLCIIEESGEFYVLINPRITSLSKKKVRIEEGCLSFPGKYISIDRPEKIKVRYLNKNGEKVKIKAEGLLARAIQHETEHLDGSLFIDKK